MSQSCGKLDAVHACPQLSACISLLWQSTQRNCHDLPVLSIVNVVAATVTASAMQGDQPGWLRLAWQYLRRPRLDPISMIGDNKSIMAFNLIWMFDKVIEHRCYSKFLHNSYVYLTVL